MNTPLLYRANQVQLLPTEGKPRAGVGWSEDLGVVLTLANHPAA